jgi:hypothetical protein
MGFHYNLGFIFLFKSAWTFYGIMGCTLMTCLMNKSLILCEMKKTLRTLISMNISFFKNNNKKLIWFFLYVYYLGDDK